MSSLDYITIYYDMKKYEEALRKVGETLQKTFEDKSEELLRDSLSDLCCNCCFPVGLYEETNNKENLYPDISSLKKRIKHCKNPMEKKKLQQELNQAYKDLKKLNRATNKFWSRS